MSDAKHTPGPWLVHDNSTLHMNDQRVAEVGHLNVVTHSARDGQTGLTMMANARLIAAAPDLLAACEAVIFDIDNDDGRFEGDAIDLVRKAIAKAKGTK